MSNTLIPPFYQRWRVRSLDVKLLLPVIGLMLISLVGSILAFIGSTAFTQNQLLKQQTSSELASVTRALTARAQTVATAASLLARDSVAVSMVREESASALGELNSRALSVRDRFDLDLVQIYNAEGQERTNLVLSSLYRESSLLDENPADTPIVRSVNGGNHILLLSQVDMPNDAGAVVIGIDLKSELHRLASEHHLPSALGLKLGNAHIGTRESLPFDASTGRLGQQYVRHAIIVLGATPVDLLLVRTADTAWLSATGLAVMVGSSLLTTLLLAGLNIAIIRSIARPIQHLSAAAQAVAEGDLSHAVDSITEPNRFGIGERDEIALLTTSFNDMVAELRSLYEGLEAKVNIRTQELTTTAHVAHAVSSSLDLDTILLITMQTIQERLGIDFVGVFIIDTDSNRMALRRATGQAGRLLQGRDLQLPIDDQSMVGYAAAFGRPRVAQDVTTDPVFCPIPELPLTGSAAAIPLLVGQTVVGVLYVQSERRDDFAPNTIRLLSTLANQIAIGVQNAQLFAQQREHAEQLERRVQERTAQFQAQYARLEAILDSASEGIVVTDGSGQIVQTNPIAQTWLNASLSPEEAAQLRQAVCGLAQRAKDRPEEVLELTGLDLELKATPISNPSLDQAAAVVAIHNVSHLKALDRMKSRFVSNVSHELRTPVTTIKLYAALMQKMSPQDEKWGQYLDVMTQEADRQAQLVNDILQISRIDTGRLEIDPQPVPLNTLAETTVLSRQILASKQGVTMQYDPSQADPIALADPERITQVLNNLVENAIHYTPSRGEIRISTGTQESERRLWATATVEDTGMGIPEGELPHIFDRFFRGEKPRLMQISGTGLGLAIVKEILDLHGGRVTVESKVEQGSTFTVWLPLVSRPSLRDPSPKHTTRQKALEMPTPAHAFWMSKEIDPCREDNQHHTH